MSYRNLISFAGLDRLGGAEFWSQARSWHTAAALTAFALGGSYHIHKFWGKKYQRQFDQNEVIIITGCDSGLGYSLAIHCNDKGATVIASVLDKDGPAAKDLKNRGIRVLPLELTQDDSIHNFVDSIDQILRTEQLKLQALINNAGVMIFGEFEWLLPQHIMSQLNVNLLGTMSITRELLPILRHHTARIINVTSHCALAALPGLSVYGATKAALMAWSSSLRIELRKCGVKVVSFIPGCFIDESKIMVRQRQHFEEMRHGMSHEAKDFYGNYFEQYVRYLSGLGNLTELKILQNPKVYEIFNAALLDERPHAVYKCEPMRYKFYHTLFRIAPTILRDWLIERFIQMPTWKGESKQK